MCLVAPEHDSTHGRLKSRHKYEAKSEQVACVPVADMRCRPRSCLIRRWSVDTLQDTVKSVGTDRVVHTVTSRLVDKAGVSYSL